MCFIEEQWCDRVRAHCSPDPIWFPRSSPPAPSAASSRSCGWRPRRGVLTWAAEEARRAEAGVEVGAAVPWRSRNALFLDLKDILIRKFVHSAHTAAHEWSFQRGSFLFKLRRLLHLKPQGQQGTRVLLILSISRSRQNERPISLVPQICDHTQFLSRHWRLIEIYLIFLPCLPWSLVLFSWNVQQKQTAGELPKAAGGFFAPSVSWFSHLRSHIVRCQI